jgi:hypothetical protein
MKNLTLLCLFAIAALIGGCATRPYQALDQEYGNSTDFAAAHAAKGARDDASLYPRHFAGDALNSLGQTKLAQIAAQAKDSTDNVNIFLVLPEAEATEARKAVVAQFLAEYGVATDRVAMAVGPNPATANLAMLTVDRVYTRKDGNISGGNDTPPAGAGGYAGSGAEPKK